MMSQLDQKLKRSSKVNVWGAISYDSRSINIFCEKMDADKYVGILDESLIKMYSAEYYILCDNDPKHTSKKAKKYIKSKGIKCIDFPPYSPDINPIENIWSILKFSLTKENTRTIVDLRETIHFIWDSIDQNSIKNTISTMKDRLEKVIKNCGSYVE